jgi:hypothetical protein
MATEISIKKYLSKLNPKTDYGKERWTRSQKILKFGCFTIQVVLI